MDLLANTLALKTVLIWGGTVLLAVAGGVYTLTKASIDDNVAALHTKMEVKDTAILDLERQLEDANQAKTPAVLPPTSTLVVKNVSPELKQISDRVVDLENERRVLLAELAERSSESLAPDSELNKLLLMLDSETENEKRHAVDGLFKLKDKRSVSTLISFYFTNREFADKYWSIYDWLGFFGDSDWKVSLEFASRILEAESSHEAQAALDWFRREASTTEQIDEAENSLKVIALTSSSTLGRTYAKLLLSEYKDIRVKEAKNELPDKRSLFGIVLDIEKDIQQLLPSEDK